MTYRAPVRDLAFTLESVAGMADVAATEAAEDADAHVVAVQVVGMAARAVELDRVTHASPPSRHPLALKSSAASRSRSPISHCPFTARRLPRVSSRVSLPQPARVSG